MDEPEIVGELPGPWGDDLRRFAQLMADHPWGGRGLTRLVVAPLQPNAAGEGALRAAIHQALREWMQSAEFATWEQEQIGRPVTTGAKSFVAHDGARTAVVLPIPQHAEFLMFATHELLEGAQSQREEREGFRFPTDDVHLANAHVMRTEYVVERVRFELSAQLGWRASSLDGVGLVEQVDDFAQALPSISRSGGSGDYPPPIAWQHWVNIIRSWAMSVGRAVAGSEVDRAALERFYAHPLIREGEAAWKDAEAALDMLWNRAAQPTQALDETARHAVWQPLHDELIDIWDDT